MTWGGEDRVDETWPGNESKLKYGIQTSQGETKEAMAKSLRSCEGWKVILTCTRSTIEGIDSSNKK